MNGRKAPIRPKGRINRGVPQPPSRMKFSKSQIKAAKKELNKERYGL